MKYKILLQLLWFEQRHVTTKTLVGCHVGFEAVSGNVKENVTVGNFAMAFGANGSKECLSYKMGEVFVIIFDGILILIIVRIRITGWLW